MIISQLAFQDATSPSINSLIEFHDETISIIIIIIFYTGSISIIILNNNLYSISVPYEDHDLESIWTIIPSSALIILALPSLRLLYILEESLSPTLTINVVGHQWYWSYDYADIWSLEFDSYILLNESLEKGEFRLLEADNRVILPWGINVRILVTSADVIHAWAIPSIGLNADAVPGRLNQLSLWGSMPGLSYGQCSEICGANHSFIPIAIEFITPIDWMDWLNNQSTN